MLNLCFCYGVDREAIRQRASLTLTNPNLPTPVRVLPSLTILEARNRCSKYLFTHVPCVGASDFPHARALLSGYQAILTDDAIRNAEIEIRVLDEAIVAKLSGVTLERPTIGSFSPRMRGQVEAVYAASAVEHDELEFRRRELEKARFVLRKGDDELMQSPQMSPRRSVVSYCSAVSTHAHLTSPQHAVKSFDRELLEFRRQQNLDASPSTLLKRFPRLQEEVVAPLQQELMVAKGELDAMQQYSGLLREVNAEVREVLALQKDCVRRGARASAFMEMMRRETEVLEEIRIRFAQEKLALLQFQANLDAVEEMTQDLQHA